MLKTNPHDAVFKSLLKFTLLKNQLNNESFLIITLFCKNEWC